MMMNLYIEEHAKPLNELLSTDDADLIDLVRQCLTFDPEKRPNI